VAAGGLLKPSPGRRLNRLRTWRSQDFVCSQDFAEVRSARSAATPAPPGYAASRATPAAVSPVISAGGQHKPSPAAACIPTVRAKAPSERGAALVTSHRRGQRQITQALLVARPHQKQPHTTTWLWPRTRSTAPQATATSFLLLWPLRPLAPAPSPRSRKPLFRQPRPAAYARRPRKRKRPVRPPRRGPMRPSATVGLRPATPSMAHRGGSGSQRCHVDRAGVRVRTVGVTLL
jgi:hypothetical protein